MTLTYYGHSCFLIETGGKRLLLDPFVTGNPLAKGRIDVQAIRCDYIFPTHGHGDHVLDLETVAKNNPEAVIVGIAEIAKYYRAKSLSTYSMNKGGWAAFDFGRVKMVTAVHSSSMPDGTCAGEPVGFVFDTPEGCVYFAGDTALTMDMQLIPMMCPTLDAAVLPIGSNYTMDYHDALLASEFVRCNRVVGCHFDTFEQIKIDREAAQATFAGKGKELILLEIGEQLTL